MDSHKLEKVIPQSTHRALSVFASLVMRNATNVGRRITSRSLRATPKQKTAHVAERRV